MSSVENSLTVDSAYGVAPVAASPRSAGIASVGSGSTDVGSARFQSRESIPAVSSAAASRTWASGPALLSGAAAFLAQTLGQSNPAQVSTQTVSNSYARAAGLTAKDGDGISVQATPRKGRTLSFYS